MEAIKEALTFDDVLLLPRFSRVLPSETDISINLTEKINTLFFLKKLMLINLIYKIITQLKSYTQS